MIFLSTQFSYDLFHTLATTHESSQRKSHRERWTAQNTKPTLTIKSLHKSHLHSCYIYIYIHVNYAFYFIVLGIYDIDQYINAHLERLFSPHSP